MSFWDVLDVAKAHKVNVTCSQFSATAVFLHVVVIPVVAFSHYSMTNGAHRSSYYSKLGATV